MICAAHPAPLARRELGRWWVWAVLLWLWGAPALAREVPALRGRVTDEAGVLTASEVRALDERLAAYEHATGRQLAVLVVESLHGDALEELSIRVVEAWKLGRAGHDDGLLVLLAVEEHKVRIEVGYGLEGEVTDLVAARIIHEDMRPYLRQGRYGAALQAGVEALIAVAGPTIAPPEPAPPRWWARTFLGQPWIWYGMISAVLVMVFVMTWLWPVIGVIAALVFLQVWWPGSIACALALWIRWRMGRRRRWRDGYGTENLGPGAWRARGSVPTGLGAMGILFGLGRMLSSTSGRGLASALVRRIGSRGGFSGGGGGFGGGGASGGW